MIKRSQLENWISITKARKLVDDFFDDQITYPDNDLYSRNHGIYKVIPEEFYPLLLLAETLSSAKKLRLAPDSLPGPDGTILLKDKSEITVQITMSHERSKGYYKKRHNLRDKGFHVNEGKKTNDIFIERLKRIIEAIKDKESKFYKGTDVLLIVDESISWGDKIDPSLPNAVKNAVTLLPPSNYSAIYVIYGRDIRKIIR